MKSFISFFSLVVSKMCWETGPLSNSLLNGAFIFATVTTENLFRKEVFFHNSFRIQTLLLRIKNGVKEWI